MEIEKETNFLSSCIHNSLKDFFNSLIIKTYLNRIRLSSILLILFAIIQCVIWNKLEFMNILLDNWIIVMCGSSIILFSNLAILIKISKITKKTDNNVINTIKCIYFMSMLNFMTSLIESLFTLFGAYLTYFESNLFYYYFLRIV